MEQQQVFFSKSGKIGILRLGLPEEKVVLLTLERMRSLAAKLSEVAKEPDLQGLIITGSNPFMFCAGVNLELISGVERFEAAEALVKEGQDVMNQLAALEIPTVAAISGPCVGGGFELALACDYRLATAIPQTRVGLPEVKIGILPGFGGTQRLPRLIGVSKALDVILKARMLPAPQAQRTGMLDRVIDLPGSNATPEALYAAMLQEARDVASGIKKISRQSLSLMDRIMTHTAPGRAIVRSKVRASIMKETRGHYPAPLKALESVVYGLAHGLEAGTHEERKLVTELVISPECKSLVHIFHASEAASKLSRAIKADVEHLKVSVIGGGVMGAGIAASFLMNDYPVAIVEPQAQARERASKHVTNALEKKRSLSENDRNRLKSKFAVTENLSPVRESDLVIEAIVEELTAKQELFARLDREAASHTMFGTNTSSLGVDEIASAVSDPKRVVGFHFFNPAERMPLVEVVRGAQTSDRLVLKAAAIVSRLGKYPVIVEDVPGFLVNRVLSPYMIEAASLLSEGFRPSDIEEAALQFGMPMGPLRLLDEVGLDIASKVSRMMEAGYGERMSGPRLAETLVGLGNLGKKSGAGFYNYRNSEEELDSQLPVKLGLSVPEKSGPDVHTEITERLFTPMVFEAIRAFDEGVAGLPGKEAAAQIDMASVMGFGFPAFRGGILYYADSLGAKRLLEIAAKYSSRGPRFAAPEGVRTRASSGTPINQSIRSEAAEAGVDSSVETEASPI